MNEISRRRFLTTTGSLAVAGLFGGSLAACRNSANDVPVYGHLWVYASEFPPDWDCTPILDRVFSDFKYAGIEGVEVMESLLRNPDILSIGKDLIGQYDVPIIGTSYNGNLWSKAEHQKILEDVEFVTERLHELGGTQFGITVGDAGRMKTEDELDAQAELLRKVIDVCHAKQIQPNIHNHTFEVANELHDLKGTIERVPDIKLGPDLSWLVKAGVDPVWFIRTYGDRIVYLHIRDNTAENVFAEAVGDGSIDFPAISEALQQIDYQGKAAIELAYEKPTQRDTRENWKISRDYVRQVFGW